MGDKKKVLIVDDDQDGLYILNLMLKKLEYVVTTASDGQEAVDKTREIDPDIIIMDVMMPNMNGFEACEIIKSDPRGKFIPIILLTAKDELTSKIEGLDVGADEYLTKPYDIGELTARIRSMLRIKQLNDALLDANVQLEELAIKDELTSLYNRRYINKRLKEEFKRASRYSDVMSFMIIDADKFKNVNDTYGHGFGDLVLKRIAAIIHESIRDDVDVGGRYGGEEFIVISPKTNLESAGVLAERIRSTVESSEFKDDQHNIRMSVSIGVSELEPGNRQTNPKFIQDEHELVDWADKALYVAKETGRNKVVKFNEIDEYKEKVAKK